MPRRKMIKGEFHMAIKKPNYKHMKRIIQIIILSALLTSAVKSIYAQQNSVGEIMYVNQDMRTGQLMDINTGKVHQFLIPIRMDGIGPGDKTEIKIPARKVVRYTMGNADWSEEGDARISNADWSEEGDARISNADWSEEGDAVVLIVNKLIQ